MRLFNNGSMDGAEPYSLEVLEFFKALDLFRRYLRTPLSLSHLQAARPGSDFEGLRSRYSEIGEARDLLEVGKRFPFEGIADIRSTLDTAALPGSLVEGSSLVRILETLRGVRLLRKSLDSQERPLAALDPYRHRIVPLEELENRLAGCLEEDGALKDSASPELRKIRERIRRQRSHIQRRLEEMCRNPDIRPLLQEDYFTERGGRYVLPVQSNYKKRLPGIQHGKSVTGTTSYIEPFELVESGNLLVEALEEETLEVEVILRSLTGRLRECLPILRPTLEAVAEFDLVVSLAEYSLESRSALPVIVPEGPLVLREIRHPLLLAQMPRESVVPNDLILESNSAGLVITGPNTGGKTVVMKTAGLLCLLALSGLPILCGEGTQVPLLGGVLADIGDEQSIEASLSTFSSHVARMKAFQEAARRIRRLNGPRPLIILDELGAGTDPSEGAALGRALLEDLISNGAWVLVATHIGDLKVFGRTHPALKTGAMRFDQDNLAPAYHLILDSVGESHGIAIARRLGLPESLIERAEELIATNPNQAAAVLHRLTEEERRARELREEIEQERAETEEKKEAVVRRLEQIARDEKRILDQARREAEFKVAAAKRRMAHIEEHIRREEEKLRRGYDGREKDLERREYQVTWLEREYERRLEILAGMARKFPNFAPELLKPAEFERLARLSEPEWKRVLREVNREEEAIREEFPHARPLSDLTEEVRPAWEEIGMGDLLRIEGLERPVSVEGKDEKKKRLSVLLGDLTLEIPYSRVLHRAATSGARTVEPTSGVRVSQLFKADIPGEINLIGMTVDEAEPLLVKYLDDAVLAGRDQVRVIHGHGTGALRNGVRKALARHPHVARIQEAEPHEGGAGATVAVLTR
ncbi:MAG: Smr/MutS family protein [Candidatus Omnitrophica bacterium]|nr:Smr/MutS family protein [Candidatus Omnitrophota bacterium]